MHNLHMHICAGFEEEGAREVVPGRRASGGIRVDLLSAGSQALLYPILSRSKNALLELHRLM